MIGLCFTFFVIRHKKGGQDSKFGRLCPPFFAFSCVAKSPGIVMPSDLDFLEQHSPPGQVVHMADRSDSSSTQGTALTMNQSSWRATRLKNLHGPGFVVGPSYEESFLNQCQSSEWQQKSTPEWIPPNQVDELVRRCEEQVIKARRSSEQSVFSSLPSRTSEDRLITNEEAPATWCRQGQGRVDGDRQSSNHPRVFSKVLVWERHHQPAPAESTCRHLDSYFQRPEEANLRAHRQDTQ